jgi:hypothetical protein
MITTVIIIDILIVARRLPTNSLDAVYFRISTSEARRPKKSISLHDMINFAIQLKICKHLFLIYAFRVKLYTKGIHA